MVVLYDMACIYVDFTFYWNFISIILIASRLIYLLTTLIVDILQFYTNRNVFSDKFYKT